MHPAGNWRLTDVMQAHWQGNDWKEGGVTMGELAYDLQQQPAHYVEIIVHVDETLGELRRSDLIEALVDTDGIQGAEFCPMRSHLMLVQYNSNNINSLDVLNRVREQSVSAELIGPV
jgi:hypothetical protein